MTTARMIETPYIWDEHCLASDADQDYMTARDVPDDELGNNFRQSGHTGTDWCAAIPLNTLSDKGFSNLDQFREMDRSLVYQYLDSRIARPVNFTSVRVITGLDNQGF